jgi:prepilin-type N-terminal cleavage/methylation domain-containing protein
MKKIFVFMTKLVNVKKNKGLSLVEVIVSLAVLGLLFALFSGVFINGFESITTAGRRNTVDYHIQEFMEKRLAGYTPSITNVSSVETGSVNMDITFGTYTVSVTGTKINTTYNDSEDNVTMTSFIPD